MCVSSPKKIILSCHQLELGTWIKIWVMWLRYLGFATYLWPDNYRPDITEIRLKRTKTRESRNCCHIIITPYDRICPSYGRNTTPETSTRAVPSDITLSTSTSARAMPIRYWPYPYTGDQTPTPSPTPLLLTESSGFKLGRRQTILRHITPRSRIKRDRM